MLIILPFIVGGVVCQTDGEWELVWVIVLPKTKKKLIKLWINNNIYDYFYA